VCLPLLSLYRQCMNVEGVWIITWSAAVASGRATILATHPSINSATQVHKRCLLFDLPLCPFNLLVFHKILGIFWHCFRTCMFSWVTPRFDICIPVLARLSCYFLNVYRTLKLPLIVYIYVFLLSDSLGISVLITIACVHSF
jgi:hypothetical protein